MYRVGLEPGEDSPENKEGGKYSGFSPLPTFNLPCCLSWLNLSGSQRADEIGKRSSLRKERKAGMDLRAHGQWASMPVLHLLLLLINSLSLLSDWGYLFI